MLSHRYKRKRNSQDEEAECVRKPLHLLGPYKGQKRYCCPDTVVKDRMNPVEGLEKRGTSSNDQGQAGA